MRQVTLIRIRESGEELYGVLEVDGIPRFVTLEPPWRSNAQNMSCVPVGKYICNSFMSSKYGLTFKLANVPGREDVVFHWGNYRKDTRGCILVGSSFSPGQEILGIINSKIAFARFIALLKDEKQFELTIVEIPENL